jgi:ATP-binding cassette subfamily F protein 3
MIQFDQVSLRRGGRVLFQKASMQLHPGAICATVQPVGRVSEPSSAPKLPSNAANKVDLPAPFLDTIR